MIKSKSTPTFKSETFLITIVKDGDDFKISVNANKYLRFWLKKNAKSGYTASMKIELRIPKRSSLQNSFYWVYLGLISLSSGSEPEDIHEWARDEFLFTGITEVFGTKKRKCKSTTDLNRSEFTEYLMRIEERTGVPIPDPKPFIGLTWEEYRQNKRIQSEYYKQIKSKKIK